METQKNVNLLNSSKNEYSKFATKKWYLITSESKSDYSHEDPIKLLTKLIESILYDYSNAYILVTGNIAVTRTIAAAADGDPQRKQPLNAATQVIFKNWAPFKKCSTEMDGTLVDGTDLINITMPMYNLIEYSDNYSDTSGSLWDFKRDEIVNNADVTNDNNAPSFKYKASLIGNTETNGTKKGVKIAVPLKYLSNFWRSLEMPLINCKIELSLKWIENCVLTTAEIGVNADATGGDCATLEVTDGKLYVSVVTLLVEDNVKLVKQLNEGFKRPIYWNKYMLIDNKRVEVAAVNVENYIGEWLDSSYQGVKRLFVLSHDNKPGNDQVKIENYDIETD